MRTIPGWTVNTRARPGRHLTCAEPVSERFRAGQFDGYSPPLVEIPTDENASPDANPVAPVPSLAAERDYLVLDRKQHDDTVAIAVGALDERLLRDVEGSMSRGDVEEWPDFAASQMTLFRLMRSGAPAAVAHLPSGLLSPNVRGKLYDLMRAVEAELR